MSKYIETVQTRTVDLDNYDRLKPYACLNYFQDAACKHGEELNVGYKESMEKRLLWIIMKTKVEIFRNPYMYEDLVITTFPSGRSRVDFTRDYILTTKQNEIVAKGTSQWCLVDLDSRKIVRTTEFGVDEKEIEQTIYSEKLTKIPNFDYQVFDNDDLSKNHYTHVISNSDLDHYGHTNNTKYAQIVFDAIKNREDMQVINFEINYNHESKLNEKVNIYYSEEKTADFIYIHGCGVIKDEINNTDKVSFTFKETLSHNLPMNQR